MTPLSRSRLATIITIYHDDRRVNVTSGGDGEFRKTDSAGMIISYPVSFLLFIPSNC